MNHNLPSQPDQTTELINEVIHTLGGVTTGQSVNPGEQGGATAAICNEQSLGRGEPAPVRDFNQILDDMSPGASGDMAAVQRLTWERLPEIIGSLRTCDKIPHPKDVPAHVAQHGNEPLRLTQPPTVGDMAAHLKAGTTSEIGLQLYGNDCVLIFGEDDNVTPPYAWQFVEERANAIIHTHPDAPDDPIGHSHYPSLTDLKLAQYTEAPQFVFSAEGILLYPNQTELRAGVTSWREHSFTLPYPNTGDPQQDYNITRREKDKYLDDVAKVQVIPWDALPPSLTVHEAVAHAVEQRRQQFERGKIQ